MIVDKNYKNIMTQATVKTVQFLDPRIEPQPDPVYDYVIGPTQNQYYKIPCSGLSNTSITFNNLTTLGVDRAYLDTFEIELKAEITFTTNRTDDNTQYMHYTLNNGGTNEDFIDSLLNSDFITFDSFPFNKCVEQARVNINGGAFFSEPLSYLRAKEHYMDQTRLSRSYANVCPCLRPVGQTESTREYNRAINLSGTLARLGLYGSRLPYCQDHASMNPLGGQYYGGFNNSIIKLGDPKYVTTYNHTTVPPTSRSTCVGYENFYRETKELDVEGRTDVYPTNQIKLIVTWREPLMCSPFSSRYDATYGRPLYNITSMDITLNMQDLGNMLRVINMDNITAANLGPNADAQTVEYITGYNVNIKSAQLCYQVMTIPPVLNKPLTTLVPYRRFVPYITDYHANTVVGDGTAQANPSAVPVHGEQVILHSGVYTFNEVPTAIWVFVAPSKSILQKNIGDKFVPTEATLACATRVPSWDTNKQFAFIRNVNFTLANTTQILSTAEPYDLYRIAQANGCDDTYLSWNGHQHLAPNTDKCFYNSQIKDSREGAQGPPVVHAHNNTYVKTPTVQPYGCGSVLRLKPGVDLIIPDQPLIPGANANNMVFQAHVDAYIPPHSADNGSYALWLLFEYVGVAAISPGQCEITMNPLGSGEIMAVSPVVSATSEETEGKLEGSGFWDSVKRAAKIAQQLGEDGIVSMILKRIPGAEKATEWAQKHGLGEPAEKRPRGGACRGGAVIGKGLNDWV